ncbi:site-specific recombinase XerC [Pseudomonas chlororaphis]|uniref:hypothetical protein n=1 Tax=Pseudomonas chlororaphis TaxID=587753 RepID=UPI0020A08B8A|nr:hypothetical protein [Pseudomonas chlororaphis]MCP1481974.1 site-specific recombinase XerC [Pseudomonas chlororaphis]MCP1597667.1 site-specific recombinase XerC [Pseudomonas chlororaphis]
MAKYYVEIPGNLSLENQSKAIQGEEALAARFVGMHIWTNSNYLLTNLAEFEEIYVAPEKKLGTPKLSKTLPKGITPAWAGQMIEQGTALPQVFLIRENPA